MSFFSFLGLVYQIFLAKIPNIAWIRNHGLLATKIGQLYALRADFIGIERSKILTKLYEQNFDEEKKTLPSVSHFSETFQKNFKRIAEIPFSEASIGKVYNAELTDGAPVVIKVIKGDFRA
jgi:predicted unusual protein kinase regulating ubiquinone biosynthesis (AarF/ABC1/UbiB family)